MLQCVVPYVLCSCVQLGKRERAATSTKMLLYNAKSMLSHGIASRYTRIFIVKILSDVHLKRSLRLSDWIIRTFAFTLTMLCALVCVFALILSAPPPLLFFNARFQCVCVHIVCMSFFYSQRISCSCSDNFVNVPDLIRLKREKELRCPSRYLLCTCANVVSNIVFKSSLRQ